jgi:hypothetical protein
MNTATALLRVTSRGVDAPPLSAVPFDEPSAMKAPALVAIPEPASTRNVLTSASVEMARALGTLTVVSDNMKSLRACASDAMAAAGGVGGSATEVEQLRDRLVQAESACVVATSLASAVAAAGGVTSTMALAIMDKLLTAVNAAVQTVDSCESSVQVGEPPRDVTVAGTYRQLPFHRFLNRRFTAMWCRLSLEATPPRSH